MARRVRTKAPDEAQASALAALLAFTPDFSGSQADIAGELERAYLAAYRVKAGVTVVPADVAQQAASVAADRAATLVTDLAQTTQDDVAGVVAQAEAGDWDDATLRDTLSGHFTFSAGRALVIAATETTMAWTAGNRQAADDAGDTEKSSESAGDADVCDDCLANEAAGWIGIDEAYPSGDDGPPFHPVCRCNESTRGGVEQEAARPVLVKEARCPSCRKLLGKSVNVGAELFCGRCREQKTVTAAA